jgi:hypothetical protein
MGSSGLTVLVEAETEPILWGDWKNVNFQFSSRHHREGGKSPAGIRNTRKIAFAEIFGSDYCRLWVNPPSSGLLCASNKS